MAVSKEDLFLAILSMDAYNRNGSNNSISVGLAVAGTSIGNATLDISQGFQSSGFFAQSYLLSGTQKIISFRGTDINTAGEFGRDVVHGWFAGGGNYAVDQMEQAAQFFQQVVGVNPTLANLYNANITLTGHSLGGGLAGLLGSIYRQSNVKIFDSMDFVVATQYLHNNSVPSDHVDQDARDLFFRSTDPGPLSGAGIKSFSVQDQTLSPNTGWFGAPTFGDTPEFNLGFNGVLSGVERHSQSLLVIRMFADATELANDWLSAGRYVFPALYDERIGTALGLLANDSAGTDSAAGKMRSMIAYSAIESGALLYGDTGVRAFYNDANDLGKVIGLSNASNIVKDSAAAISTILTQFAGQLAVGKVDQATHVEALAGVLTLAADQKTLSVDLSEALWSLGRGANGAQTNIIGRDDLVDAVSTQSIGSLEGDVESGMTWLWASDKTDVFDKIVFATTNASLTTTLAAHAEPSSKVSLFVAGGSIDKITGRLDGELIYGGGGADELWGGDGNDLLAGGAGDDTLHAGTGKSYLAGGADTDTASFDAMNGGTFKLSKETSTIVAPTHTVTHGEDVTKLQSVEKIKLSDSADIVEVGASANVLGQNSNLYGLQEIDAAGGVDKIDFSASRTAIVVASNVVVGPDTLLKNFENIIGTAFADTFKFSSPDEFAGLQKLDAAGQSDGTSDTLDFSQMTSGVTISGSTRLDNFEKIIGTSSDDNIEYSNGTAKIEVYGRGGRDKITTGSGNDKLFGGAGKDRLTGGAGGDEFYVGSGDIVLDSDSTDKLFVGDDASEDEADYIEVTQPGLAHMFIEYADLKGNYLEGYNHFYGGQSGYGMFINTGHSLVILNGSEANPDYVIAKDYQTGDFGLDIFDPAKLAAKAKEHYAANTNGWPTERFILTPYLEFLRIAMGLEAQANQANQASMQGQSNLLQVLETTTGTEIAGTQDIDFLQGTAADDEMVGGGEMDLLLGGAGSDIYRYAAGDGDDYIMDYDGGADDLDVLMLDNLNVTDIELSGGGTDLYIDVLGTEPSTITIINQFGEQGLEGVEEIHFADGTVWNRAQILEALQVVRGTDGDDELYVKAQQIDGEWQPTVFVGGHGDDHLYGGEHGDTYVYAKGDGNDTIQDFGDNVGTLCLSDLNPDDISASRLPDNSIVITIGETGETITVKPYWDQTVGFDQIVFADGTVWDREDILAAISHAPTSATLTGDSVAENAVNGTIVGTVAGVDPDEDAVLTYALTDNAGGWFAIDATTGQITVANGALLDYETATSHSVVVRVTDQAGLTLDKSFTLSVTNINEAPAGATLTGGSVAENATNGTVVGTVAGSDPDAGSTLTYALTDDAGGRFSIDASSLP